MFGAVMLVSAVAAIEQQRLLDARPGGIVHVPNPYAVQWLPKAQPAAQKDCEGCGAPLRAYLHHCEYCRREK